MSASQALQTAIFEALVADAGVDALVGDRIFDGRPADRAFPNVTFGPTQRVMDDMDCVEGEVHFVQLDVWDRSQSRKVTAEKICDAIKAALHDATLALVDPHAVGECLVEDVRVLIDADGITAHGIVTLRALVEV